MTRRVAAELLLLRRRPATWILLSIWTLLGVFFGYVIPYARGTASGDARFFPPALAGNVLAGFPFFGGVFAVMLGVFAVGSEYGWDTLKTLFTQGRSRGSVMAAKCAALGLVLGLFVVSLFAAGAVASVVIARHEHAATAFPSAWLLVRALAAGWLMLAVWAAAGVLLGVLTRGTSVAIGVGILYALVVEGLLSEFADSVGALKPLAHALLRANGYSLARALGASVDTIGNSRPGSFSGPFVTGGVALAVLAAYVAVFAGAAAWLLRRRDLA